MEGDDIYPDKVCNSCYISMTNWEKTRMRGEVSATLDIHCWIPHSEPCTFCLGAVMKAVGGRPKKRVLTGRPSSHDPKKVIQKMNALNIPFLSDSRIDKSIFLDTPFLNLVSCQICQCIPGRPIELATCRHLICCSCISETGRVTCCSDDTIGANELRVPSDVVLAVLQSLLVRCSNNCGQVVELQHLKGHLASNCRDTEIPPPTIISVQQLLDQKLSEPHPSLMTSHNVGLLVDLLLPSSGSVMCKTPTGKV